MVNNKIAILIIDDDEVDKQAVRRALKSSGFNVDLVCAHDLESGISAAENNYFDCIFLDYSLPGATGFDFLDRYTSINGQAPVIMITSLGDEQLAVEAMKKGACDYIPKSLISPEGISQSMRYALKLSEVNQNTFRIEKALKESERKLENVINNSPLILFSLDKQGVFTMFKGNGTKNIEASKEQIIGTSIFDISAVLPVKLNDYLSASLGKETCFKTTTGVRHFEVNFTPVRDENGNLVEMIGVITDITAMKQNEEDLIKTITIAEESSKIKEQFLANMSHEIRTPVHGIMSLADILSKTKLDENQATYLNAVKKSADNLLVIINDILDLSKLESGKMTFENTPFDFMEVLNMSIELFRHKAEGKGLQLIREIDSDIPQIMKGDPVRLSQILNNLISNAIKFTETGHIKIVIRTVERNESGCIINFEISDTGIGIPAKKLSSIFETFTQAANDTTRKYGGTGLGLSIVKMLTELQGGYITVESELNKGTIFRVNLPLEFSEIEESPNANSTLIPAEAKLRDNLRILVVEDNEINQMIINKLLKDWGLAIENAGNGVEAVEMISKNAYDIVLMDIEMPEMNGYEAAKHIRKVLPSPKNEIPILAMTAHASAKEREKCFTSGMNDYISKPFDPADVKNKIILLTSGAAVLENEKPDCSSGSKPEPFEMNTEGRYTNLSFLKEMSDDNDTFIRDFITLFLQNAPESIQQLEKHLERKEWEPIRQIAHKIKPSFNYLGLKDLHAAAATIEELAKTGSNPDEITSLIKKISSVCNIAFKELEEDIKTITL